ncbi:MAG: hypothetical protein V5A16_05760 [Haloplanus sp.]
MSSTRNWRLSIGILALVVLAYAFEAGNVLFGIFVGAVIYLIAWLIDRVSPGNPLEDMTPRRRRATGGIVLLILAYSGIVSATVLLGILVAAVVAAVSWLTSPIGPVARWLDGVA